jgi:ABC-type transporter Mla MlaB component
MYTWVSKVFKAVCHLIQVQHLMLSGDISQKTLQSLWDRVIMKTAGCTAADSRAALILMTMAAR